MMFSYFMKPKCSISKKKDYFLSFITFPKCVNSKIFTRDYIFSETAPGTNVTAT